MILLKNGIQWLMLFHTLWTDWRSLKKCKCKVVSLNGVVVNILSPEFAHVHIKLCMDLSLTVDVMHITVCIYRLLSENVKLSLLSLKGFAFDLLSPLCAWILLSLFASSLKNLVNLYFAAGINIFNFSFFSATEKPLIERSIK